MSYGAFGWKKNLFKRYCLPQILPLGGQWNWFEFFSRYSATRLASSSSKNDCVSNVMGRGYSLRGVDWVCTFGFWGVTIRVRFAERSSSGERSSPHSWMRPRFRALSLMMMWALRLTKETDYQLVCDGVGKTMEWMKRAQNSKVVNWNRIAVLGFSFGDDTWRLNAVRRQASQYRINSKAGRSKDWIICVTKLVVMYKNYTDHDGICFDASKDSFWSSNNAWSSVFSAVDFAGRGTQGPVHFAGRGTAGLWFRWKGDS